MTATWVQFRISRVELFQNGLDLFLLSHRLYPVQRGSVIGVTQPEKSQWAVRQRFIKQWKAHLSKRLHNLFRHLLGVAEQHQSVVGVEQRIVDAGVSRT